MHRRHRRLARAPLALLSLISVLSAAPLAGCDGSGRGVFGLQNSPGAATLVGLTITGGTLTPAFNSGTTAYSAAVANGTTSITLTPRTPNSSATISVNGSIVANGATSTPIPLAVGANVITILVTEGTASRTYTVTVTRAA